MKGQQSFTNISLNTLGARNTNQGWVRQENDEPNNSRHLGTWARQLRHEQITQAEKASRDQEQRAEKPAKELKNRAGSARLTGPLHQNRAVRAEEARAGEN
jgi:hypothetical protein